MTSGFLLAGLAGVAALVCVTVLIGRLTANTGQTDTVPRARQPRKQR